MSCYMYSRGIVKLVDKLPDETLEEQMVRLLKEHGPYEPDDPEDIKEDFCDNLSDFYVVASNNIYLKVSNSDTYDCDGEFFNVKTDTTGKTIEYEGYYYNGGTCWEELLVDKLEENK